MFRHTKPLSSPCQLEQPTCQRIHAFVNSRFLPRSASVCDTCVLQSPILSMRTGLPQGCLLSPSFSALNRSDYCRRAGSGDKWARVPLYYSSGVVAPSSQMAACLSKLLLTRPLKEVRKSLMNRNTGKKLTIWSAGMADIGVLSTPKRRRNLSSTFKDED